jgi:hypothetical protein
MPAVLPQTVSGQAAPRVTRWDDDGIRAALREFLRGRSEWPTYREFVRGGAKGLRDAVTRHGGAAKWAQEFGLAGGDRPRGGAPRWTDDRVRAALTAFLDKRDSWPTRAEFDDAGLSALREVLRRDGSGDRWASEFGMRRRVRESTMPSRRTPTPQARRRREWPLWTRTTIRSELEPFLAGRRDWPPYSEFIAAGKNGLHKAVLAHGGSRAWAHEMGVVWVDRRPPIWTDDRVRKRLAAFLGGRASWPTEAEFAAAGEAQLLAAVRRHGGTKQWAREFALSTARRVEWDDARIESEIAPLVKTLGRWPTKGEFRRAGLSKALAAVYTHGGSRRWQKRLHVRPVRYSSPVPDRRVWSEERIERELREFLAGRERWPGARAFELAGLGLLYRAAGQHGGIAHWRRRLGFD